MRHGRKMTQAIMASLLLVTGSATAGTCDNPQTQMEMNQCASNALEAETTTINSVYNRYRASLSPAEKLELKNVQLAWIQYKDLACKFEASAVDGGSMQPYVLARCLTDQTQARRKQLDSLLRCDAGPVPGSNCGARGRGNASEPKPLPSDAQQVTERLASCSHFSGEINGDGSDRDKEVFSIMTKLHCDTVDKDVLSIRKKYADSPLIQEALDSASQQ